MNDTHLDIFSGIGGFSLASEWAGFRTVAFAELDPEASLVLAHHWPNVPNVRDIRATRWDRFRRAHGRPALLTGGVPCQPASLLGKRLGSADERWLWPDTLGIVRELRPLACVFENPPALLSLDDGRAFGGILGGLAALGYDVLWGSVFAAAVDAGHLRERICIVATDATYDRERAGTGLESSTGLVNGQDGAHADANGSGWRTRGLTRHHARQAEQALPVGVGPNAHRIDGRNRTGGRDGQEVDNRGIQTPPHPHNPRLEGHERDGDDLDQSGRLGAVTARSTAARDLRGRVFAEDWWHEAHTGIPVLAHGIPTRLAEAAARCTGNSIVPQAFYPILKAIFDHLNP